MLANVPPQIWGAKFPRGATPFTCVVSVHRRPTTRLEMVRRNYAVIEVVTVLGVAIFGVMMVLLLRCEMRPVQCWMLWVVCWVFYVAAAGYQKPC